MIEVMCWSSSGGGTPAKKATRGRGKATTRGRGKAVKNTRGKPRRRGK